MRQRNIYSNIKSFGPTEVSMMDNPISYCIGTNISQQFDHGSSAIQIDGQNSKPCQSYLSDYCAVGWDGFCEFASNNKGYSWPNNIGACCSSIAGANLTSGEVLVRNTASKKYLVAMADCYQKFEPFDPTVANSPMISYWVPGPNNYSNSCTPTYRVDPKIIDKDVVMDKILSNPKIAIDILKNIYYTMSSDGSIKQLDNTKIGKFFRDNEIFFKN